MGNFAMEELLRKIGKLLEEEINELKFQLTCARQLAEEHIIKPLQLGDYGWSQAYASVLELRRQYEDLVHRADDSPKDDMQAIRKVHFGEFL